SRGDYHALLVFRPISAVYRLDEGVFTGAEKGRVSAKATAALQISALPDEGNMTKYLTLIFKNLLRSKRRNILTILSIAVSLFIFSVLVSLPTFANQMLADTTSSVRIICRTKMGLAYPLPVAYKPKIAAIPHVVAVAPLVIYGGIYHE